MFTILDNQEDTYNHSIKDAISSITQNNLQAKLDQCIDVKKPTAPIVLQNIPDDTIEDVKDTMYYTHQDAIHIAKVLYRECRGIKSTTEKACVAWTILNRVDAFEDTVYEVVSAPYQFAYKENTPVWDELLEIANDVLERWNLEKNGVKDVGRVLPKEYLYFLGDGKHNHFRNAYKEPYEIWDYSLESPYES